MKFIHAADLHIDSPLLGLCCYEGAPAERLREATRRALEHLVELAVEEEVAFVILAGDLFDGKWRNMQTGLFTARQFRRLGDEQIRVFLVRGNHDAESTVRPAITWPDNVKEFSVRKVDTFRLDELGVALHGRGFAQPEVADDPVPEYPAPVNGMFNIGVLHTNVGGSKEHPRYAPTTREALEAKGYDYWALGHIHKRYDIADRPYIAYSGNTQGRHIRETGPKGGLLVSVEDGQLAGVEFRPTDVVRWHWPEITLADRDGLPELYAAVREQLERCQTESDGRFAAVRLTIAGRCAAHNALLGGATRAEAIAEIRNQANELEEEVWVEEIRFDTSPAVDLEKLRAGGDLLGELLRQIDDAANDGDKLAALGRDHLAALEQSRPGLLEQAGVKLQDPAKLSSWLRQAEGLLVGQLLSGGDDETA
jgi:DNA repair exonuclease SbcCD nuclease subunit